MNNHYKILLSLCIFSILYSLFFSKIYQYPILGDERTYYAYGLNLYKGNGYLPYKITVDPLQIEQEGKDTSLFKNAGVQKVVWLQTHADHL